MKPGQDAIFYITGDEVEALKKSPQLEGFAARGVEVLLLTDPIDEFWIPAIGTFQDKPLKSVTRGGADLAKISKPEGGEAKSETTSPGVDSLVAMFRLTLKEAVKDVRHRSASPTARSAWWPTRATWTCISSAC
jgi:molecular chaperone HtpG